MQTMVKSRWRRRLAGGLIGAGFAGFGLNTLDSVWRPHSAADPVFHGNLWFWLAELAQAHAIFAFWLTAGVGILLAPGRLNSRSRKAIDDPDGTLRRWAGIGVAVVIAGWCLAAVHF